MKQLMLGNAAVARGLFEGGCGIISSYPGTPSTEITEEAAKYKEIYCEWAPNEKVAFESAFGASLAGKRAFCAMKHVGLNVAADPLFTAAYTGVNAGLVVGVADDAGMHSSQNEQDSRHHAIASKIPMIEPSDSEEARKFAKWAFEISEQFDTPVLFKMCTRVAHSQGIVETEDRTEVPLKKYERNIQKYVMAPANAIRRHPEVEQRLADLAKWSEISGINRTEMGGTEFGIITSSTSYQYVKEIFGDSVSILKLGMVNPLPANMIKEFCSKVKTVVVVEELDPIIETFCKANGCNVYGKDLLPVCGEYSQNLIRKCLAPVLPASLKSKAEFTIPNSALDNLPNRPPIMCAGCPHRGLFYALKKLNVNVLGDIGCYTLGSVAPLSTIDMVLCMGASFSSIHGWNKALGTEGEKKTVAVIGDSTFMHSGMTGLATIAYNQSNSTVIVLDNSITGMTGHQQNPTTGKNLYGDPAGRVDLEALAHAMGIERVRVVDPYNIDECFQAVKEELAVEAPSLIISRRPCALLKEVKPKPALMVNADKCRSCKMCMKIGCPAIAMKNNKAQIDPTLCVGCGVCTQMCNFGAIN